MKCYGLIGFPLSHSFSEKYFTEKFKKTGIKDTKYKLFPLNDLSLLPQLIADNPELYGLNVTIPHKEKVIPFLDTLDDPVREIGAVNTIKIYREGRAVLLKGYNTDVFGFASSLYSYVRPGFKNALILGTGGASKAVVYVLKKWGLQVTCVSRSPKNSDQISYSNVTPELIRRTNLIVNTTPAGMYPEVLVCPEIPYESITSEHVLFDLIYNPEVTMFMEKGKLQGAIAINGMGMLYKQADKAWEIWNSEVDTMEISMP